LNRFLACRRSTPWHQQQELEFQVCSDYKLNVDRAENWKQNKRCRLRIQPLVRLDLANKENRLKLLMPKMFPEDREYKHVNLPPQTCQRGKVDKLQLLGWQHYQLYNAPHTTQARLK